MDPISFGLGLVGEVRHQVNSMKTRISNFQDGENSFKSLRCKLDLLVQCMSEVHRLLNTAPNAVPAGTSSDFNKILADVFKSIKDEDWTIPQSLAKPFAGSSSSAMGKIKLHAHQFTKAKELKAAMSSLEMKIATASSKLLHLSSVLTNALISKDLQTIVVSKMDEQRMESRGNQMVLLSKLDNIRVSEAVKEVYTPMSSTPAPSHAMILDFISKDEKGNAATPEGLLRESVLDGDSSEVVTAVTGSIRPAYGVLGMAGVGKTVALRALGHDEDVKKRFNGGVHYMTFGRDATLQTAIGEIASIMTLTGASTQVQNVKGSTSLREAVNYALLWFEGKVCLYVLDDLWPSESLPHGYFDDLRQLLRGSPHSRMAISTRSLAIASQAGRVVDFGPRNPLGKVSAGMFLSHATAQSSPQSLPVAIHDLRPSVSKILSICGGLPIALSVTGCAVSKLVRVYGTFDKACDAYAVKLEKKRTVVGDKCTAYGSSLKAAIFLSLEHLEFEFLEWAIENSIEIDSSIFDLYTSLCVFSNQAWVSVSVLSRLWKLEKDAAFDIASLFSGMSLATLTVRRLSNDLPDEAGIVLHDLHLDFCQGQARETKKFPLWHAQLLNGYMEANPQHIPEENNGEVLERILKFTPRAWWSGTVPEDGYIHTNLSRHLRVAGHGTELAALLLEGRWTQMRGRIGGIMALETDFELLENFLRQEPGSDDIWRCFKYIFKAVRLSWGRMAKGLRVFQFQACGRLTSMKKSSTIVEAYLKSIEKCTPKPYLLPMSSFFPDVESSLIMEIPLGGECSSVSCSPCGRYIACGAGSDIVIAKSSNGEIIQRMKNHKSRVACLAFAGGSKAVVSGSQDGTVVLWDLDLPGYSARVFEGHGDLVTGVAIKRNGGQIFSCSSDGTLRIWGTAATAQASELPQSSAVYCISVSGDGDMIAYGLGNGKLKVVDCFSNDVLFEHTDSREFSVLCASFCPNGSYLATGSRDNTIRVWNTRTWTREGASLNAHKGWVSCASFSPDGKQMASSSYDGTICLWDVKSGKCAGISPKIASVITSVSFTEDGQRIASGSWDGILRIWDVRFGTESKENAFRHSDSVWGAAISQNGLRVCSASRDGTVRLWDTHTGEQVGASLEGHTNAVTCVAFSPDGQKLVSGSADNTLRLWDTGTQTQIWNPFDGHTGSVYSAAFSFEGLRIVSGSSDCTVRIWNAETHEQVGEALQGHTSSIVCVSETFDGRQIVFRDRNGIVFVWNCDTRSMVWISEPRKSGFENKIADDEAESIILSCGQQNPHLWPKSFPAYTAELYCEEDSVYSNLLEDKPLLADILLEKTSALTTSHWWYHKETNIFSACLNSGTVAMCALIKK